MKAAVIGVHGYIGKHLAFYLQQKGWNVTGYGRSAQSEPWLPSYKTVDVTEKATFSRLDTDVDFIFYFSGLTGTHKSFGEYENYIDTNEKGLIHLLDRLRSVRSKARVVFPSTRLVYKGIENVPLHEEAEKEFKTVYALTKWFGEQVLQQYSAYFDIPYTVFRICVPYGNLFSETYSYGTIGFFLDRAKSGQDITLFGNGAQKRTFTHVDDICRQIYYGLMHKDSVNNVFNIGGGTFSLEEIATLIAEKCGVNVKFSPWPEMDWRMESGDTIFDASRLERLTGQISKYNFSHWLRTIS